MYKIRYSFYERDKDKFSPKGQPIFGEVFGSTIKELDKNFAEVRNNHDVFKYTQINFASISEFKK